MFDRPANFRFFGKKVGFGRLGRWGKSFKNRPGNCAERAQGGVFFRERVSKTALDVEVRLQTDCRSAMNAQEAPAGG